MRKQYTLTVGLIAVMTLILGFANAAFAQCDPNSLPGNCVLYARSLVPQLPYGLTYYSDKQAIINHRFPRVGSVAVMPLSGSSYGHVAVVDNVAIRADGGLSLTLKESNWTSCQITTSYNVTPESRNIEGYFDPSYPSGQSNPKISSLTNNYGYSGTQFYVNVSGSGFNTSSAQGIILGGWCDYFGKCTVPNNVILNKTTTGMQVPVTLSSGNYTLYIYNSSTGKTSNGKPITIY
ncbi:MAG TPA: CHAP domain-containing protein [Pyrinomonadaceae bacterium]|jgi:hypothetical protein